jgi:hypothetical protein
LQLQQSSSASRFLLPYTLNLQQHLLCILHRDLSGEHLQHPPIAPHPDVYLNMPAACPTVWPGIISSSSWNVVLKRVSNVDVTAALHQLETAQNVFHRANVECQSWEAALWYCMGMQFLCMKLLLVREIGLYVLKK